MLAKPARLILKLASAGLVLAVLGCAYVTQGDWPALSSGSARSEPTPRMTASSPAQLAGCLAGLSATLRDDPSAEAVDLQCADGARWGRTDAGQACALTVDAEHGEFGFDYQGVMIGIERAAVGVDASGQRRFNLESADVAPGQPGVRMTRSGTPADATTESLALHADGSFIEMTYRRVRSGGVDEIGCRVKA